MAYTKEKTSNYGHVECKIADDFFLLLPMTIMILFFIFYSLSAKPKCRFYSSDGMYSPTLLLLLVPLRATLVEI